MPSRTTEFEGLLEAVPDALVGVDKAGVIRFVNRQTESLFGYPRDELVGRQLEMLVPQSLRGVHQGHRQGYTAAPVTRPMGSGLNLLGRRQDGSEFPVDISLSRTGTGDDMVLIAAVRDMTRYRKAEADQRRLDRLAEVVEFSGEAIISHTLDGIITSWNPAAEKLFGYSSQEIIGQSIKLLAAEDKAEARNAILARVGQGQAVEHIETVHLRKDGTAIPVHLTVSPIRDADGSVVGASAILHDTIAQRHALEAAQRMAAIVEYSEDAIISITLDGVVTSWNPAAERMFGWSSEEIVAKPGSILGPEDRADEVRDILARLGAGQSVERFESVRVRKDGTQFPVSVTVSRIFDADGSIIGGAAMMRDLSEQTRTFESARSMIETSLDSFVAISPQGQITDANEATVSLTGVPRDSLIGTSFSGYFIDPNKAEEIYQRVLTQGSVTNHALTLRRLDGHETLTEVLYNASAYHDASGNVLGVFASARDVTDLKRAAQYARSLIEAALDPLVTINPEGKITDANEAAAKATAVPRDKLIGTSFSDYFTDPKKAHEAYQLVFEHGAVTNYPLTLRHKNGEGTLTEVLYSASLYRDGAGKVLGVFAAARDVTSLVESQKKLAEQQARELERLAELERFQRLTVGRELKMIELKKEIEYLRKRGPADGGESGDQD